MLGRRLRSSRRLTLRREGTCCRHPGLVWAFGARAGAGAGAVRASGPHPGWGRAQPAPPRPRNLPGPRSPRSPRRRPQVHPPAIHLRPQRRPDKLAHPGRLNKQSIFVCSRPRMDRNISPFMKTNPDFFLGAVLAGFVKQWQKQSNNGFPKTQKIIHSNFCFRLLSMVSYGSGWF